jgi:hypothetical protein
MRPRLTTACSGYDFLRFDSPGVIPAELTNYCGRWTSKLDSNSDPDAHTTTATLTTSDVNDAAITDVDAYAYETSTGSSTLLVHDVWSITWSASDIPNLTPQPPTITSSKLIPTWRPGEVVSDGKYDRQTPGSDMGFQDWDKIFYFLVIGLPIIGLLSIGSCVFCCVRHNKKVRARREADIYAAGVAAANAAANGNVVVAVERVVDK